MDKIEIDFADLYPKKVVIGPLPLTFLIETYGDMVRNGQGKIITEFGELVIEKMVFEDE